MLSGVPGVLQEFLGSLLVFPRGQRDPQGAIQGSWGTIHGSCMPSGVLGVLQGSCGAG